MISPTYVPDLVNACLDLMIDGERGVWHLANAGALSWKQFGSQVAALAGFDAELISEGTALSPSSPAVKPPYSVLGSERGQMLPPLADALERYFADSRSLESQVTAVAPLPAASADISPPPSQMEQTSEVG